MSLQTSWKRNMTETLSQNGFEDVRHLRFEYSLTMARYWNDMYGQDLLNIQSFLLTVLIGIWVDGKNSQRRYSRRLKSLPNLALRLWNRCVTGLQLCVLNLYGSRGRHEAEFSWMVVFRKAWNRCSATTLGLRQKNKNDMCFVGILLSWFPRRSCSWSVFMPP